MTVSNLTGRSALVTGAASGIGYETCLAFAKAGAHVVAVDVNADNLAVARTSIEAAGGRCLVFKCDVSDAMAVAALAKDVTAAVGPPDVLVNNAGVGYIGPFLETPPTVWANILGVNLMGMVHINQAFLPAMLAAGGARHLVNVASAAALQPVANMSAYSASKHAVVGLSDTLAMELAHTSVGITLVCPGVINTPIVQNRRAVAPSVPAATLDRLSAYYQAKGAPPSLVAARIVRAVRRGEDLVLVGPTARLVYHSRRLSRRWLRNASLAGARKLGYLW